MKKIIVKQNEENPIPIEVMAESIKSISDGIKKLISGPLNRDCLILLIQNAAPSIKRGQWSAKTKISARDIKAVLDGISNLEKSYLRIKP